ncbi:RNase_H superfamily protein [uncultured archaeon]|nr:RNase_H superfamily protein [uncultured archaeon]
MQAKILFLDIETAPSLGWVWAKWETNVIDFKQDWYILSYAYKWAGEDKVTTVGLPDFGAYNRNKEDDRQLTKSLRKLLDEADVVIAHNGDGFDLPKINTRMLTHKLAPPSPYKTVDTLKIARKTFKFDSNKLDDLGRYLGIGRKLPHTGFHLWKNCMDGKPEAWKMMKEYNGHDVELLEKVYYIMRPWTGNTHPNVNQFSANLACPKCGNEQVQRRGYSYTQLSRKQRFQCTGPKGCGTWYEGSAKKV